MSTPKYSIVIPTYNHFQDCLKPCLESIISYTNLFDIEVLIVANGCTDETKEYVTTFSKKNPQFKLVWFDKPLGYTVATNEGIKQAKGEFIVLLNNDCQILPYQPKNYWIETLAKPFADAKMGMTGINEKYSEEIRRNFLVFYCVMIRASVFNKIGLLDEIFNTGFGEDIDFCARLHNAGYTYVNCETNQEQHPTMVVGTYPLYHKSSATFHADEKISAEYEKIVQRNLGILKRRYAKAKPYVKYSIVIPSYNQCENLLKPCLESIKATTDLSETEIIVIANGCTDNTEEYVNSLGAPFRVLNYKEQLGYPRATNNGIKDAQGEFIVLLNNDTEIYKHPKGWLNILREPFDTGAKIGMTGVMLFKGDKGFSNDFIMFFCCMTTRKVINDVGLLDENFGLGGVEDVDYGLRLTLAGYELVEVMNENNKRSSGTSTGAFPIHHAGCSTVRHEKDWNENLKRNNEYLKQKFPEYFKGIDWINDMDKDKPKVYDCFLFFNELDLLELRFEELNDTVDFFVIAESPITHKGEPKPLYYQENKQRFAKYHHKIIYLLVDDFPNYKRDDYQQYWNREQWQRNALAKALLNCQNHDIILLSDADEIPNPEAIKEYKENRQGVMSLKQNLYYYDFHHLAEKKWTKAKIMRYKDVREGKTRTALDESLIFSSYFRNIEHPVIVDGGWHFSYLADVKGIIQKLQAFSHQEFNNHPFTSENYIRKCIDENKNLFSDDKLIFVEIDETYPKAILTNLNNQVKYITHGFIKITVPPLLAKLGRDAQTVKGKQILKSEIFYEELNKLESDFYDNKLKQLKEIDYDLYHELFELNLNQIERSEIEGKTIVDIGGNKGYFSIQCLESGAKECYCFEPVKKIYNQLIDITKEFPNIHTYHLAVLDGTITEVHMHEDGMASHIWGNKNAEATKCISLVEALQYVTDKSNMVLKLDCEGSEFEIIFNTPIEVLEQFKTIYIEIHDELNPNYIHQSDLLLKYIEALGFELKKGLQAGTYMPDGSFKASPLCIYKCLRKEIPPLKGDKGGCSLEGKRDGHTEPVEVCAQDKVEEIDLSDINISSEELLKIISKPKFTIVYINHSKDDLEKYLQPSLNNLNKYAYELIYSTDENCPAKNYNEIIRQSQNKYIILLHQDIIFPPDFLECIRKTIKAHPNFGVLGLVGFDEFAKINRFTMRAITDHAQKVDFLDSCCIVINKEHGIKFDETTFDDFHLYVEDYCMQAKEKGLQNYTILADFNKDSTKLKHIGSTYIKNGNKMWGKYDEYYSIFLKKWTKRLGVTLRTDSHTGATVHKIEDVLKPRACIIIQATGNYYSFVKNLVESINWYFMTDVHKDVIILSDTPPLAMQQLGENCVVHSRICKPVTKASYFFELMLEHHDLISKADYVYKMDADMIMYDEILGKDILPNADKNFSIVKHFAFDQKRMTAIQPEWFSARIPEWFQNCDGWQSCLFGGRTENMLQMARELDAKIKTDRANNKMWGAWEEPYVNWYFAQRQTEVRTLSPTYATPLYWHRLHPNYKQQYLNSVGNDKEKIFHFNHTVQFGGHEVG